MKVIAALFWTFSPLYEINIRKKSKTRNLPRPLSANLGPIGGVEIPKVEFRHPDSAADSIHNSRSNVSHYKPLKESSNESNVVLLFVGESRFVSDLSVQRRDALQQRVAFRLAHPTPTSRPSTTAATTPETAIVVQEFVQSATVNVPFSPIINDVNDSNSVVVKDLPKCLMKSDGSVFD